MRVCILHRPGAVSGGDYVAMHGYAKALARAGLGVTFAPADRHVSFDVFSYVHLWAACSPDWGLAAAHRVKAQATRLIITPFWWSRVERQAFYGRAGQDLMPGYTEAVGETLRIADVIFPVTNSEADQCRMLAPDSKYHIVPMGTDRPRTTVKPAEDFVLCIGRIEPHKNQHSLAEACARLGKRLVLVTSGPDNDYVRVVKARHKVDILRRVNNETRERLLSIARVHALPSFFENPGLVHGEAIAMGVPAVMGSHGCEPEFYGERGVYCDPTSVDSIADAIETAWDKPRVLCSDLPTWDDAARKAMQWMC